MAFKDAFLSKWRSFRREKADRQEESPEEQENKQEEEEVYSSDMEALTLYLRPDHPLNRLWSLYMEQIEHPPVPAPVLRLKEVPSEPSEELPEHPKTLPALLTVDDAKQELPKLEELITTRVEGRLARLLTREEDVPFADLDAEVQVFLTASYMTAWIFVYPPSGSGADLSIEMLKDALEAAKVCYGVDQALLDSLPESPDQYFHLYLVARGKLPVHGKDGYVTDKFSRSPKRKLVEDESGRVDYAALELFQNAKKGDVICVITPPTPCYEGRTVLDKAVPARPGTPPVVPKGRNTELSEDGTALIASCEGNVEFSGRSFQVKPVLDIGGNVDFSTGNINCLGDVHIRGDVCSGFTVRATGNITVDGVVEACVIEAGGDLIVRKGVQGNNRAILRAHRSIYAKYLENTSVYARENLETDCIINCDIYSDGMIRVRSGRGAIIGGQVRATHEVSANVVGARSEWPTTIILGGKPCEDFERECLARDILELEDNLEKLSRQPDSPAKNRQMSKTRVQISANKMKLQQFDKNLENQDEEEPGLRRMVCSTVYPGTEIIIDTASLKVADETKMCTAFLKNGEVVLSC